ncbi:hypothetical protein [Moraxella bovis]|uniref:Uncharacterized protein n=1 Tax=Moraxella bovis TaxID=476 RepID=A0AAX3ERZ7_MORBO|nr:hypothetical protein [Moraxella bovis]UYZ74537.1 hypothetical protein LP093_07010 [Moraxella bovis]UYZ79538.1 hypothetical protein LP115_06895 [Moraxella bovis]UYZ88019.1 hypothetical protein LP094_06900 [Moraxella bovis]UYZ93422.1 hypothetical protein LP103_06750 [Moraxella bovis]UYZ96634.1 hypothetical protein LP107_06970 [Moraxella bovis]
MLSQALSVFDFLKIKYPKHNPRFALCIIPMFVGVLFAIFGFYLSHQNVIIFTHERFGDIFTFLAILPGFYIASLAAIGTISKKSIDNYIDPENSPYLVKREPDRTETYNQPLTRRLFLSLLFAYLASITLLLVISLVGIRFYLSIFLLPTCVVAIIYFIVFFVITQIMLLSLVGISYLGYKSLANN